MTEHWLHYGPPPERVVVKNGQSEKIKYPPSPHAVTRFPSEISLNTTEVKNEPFKPLLDNLERAKKTWFDLNDHWFKTSDEKKVQAKLMELVDWTCLIIEQTALGTEEEFKGVVDKEGNTFTPTQAKKHFVEKLEALKKDKEIK